MKEKLLLLGIPFDARVVGDAVRPTFSWKEGPVSVTIEPAFYNNKEDWRVTLYVLNADVEREWRNTPELCAKYAERVLIRIRKALTGAN